MGLTFDLYTHTETENHWNVTQQMFLQHLKAGYVYKDTQKQLYDPIARRFLADRYVEGTCPYCGYADARGDQCDNCGRLYDALELKNPREEIARIGRVTRNVELGSRIEVGFGTGYRGRDALILALQVDPGLVVVGRRD